MKKVLLVLIIVYSAIFASAQPDTLTNQETRKYTKNWNLSFEQGAMLGNGTDIGDQLAEESYYNGLDFRLGFRLNDHSDIYNQVYRLPEMGVGWYSSTFHQEEIGKPNALYYYFNMPIRFERSRKLEANARSAEQAPRDESIGSDGRDQIVGRALVSAQSAGPFE